MDDKIEKNRMGGACSMYRRKGRYIQGFGEEIRGKHDMEDPGVDGKIILRGIFRKWDGGAWTGLIWLTLGTGGGHL